MLDKENKEEIMSAMLDDLIKMMCTEDYVEKLKKLKKELDIEFNDKEK